MFARIFLLLVVLVGIMWFAGKLGKSNSHDRKKLLKLAALWGGTGILIALILTGKLHALFALLGPLVVWIQRIIMMQSAYQMFNSWKGPTQGSKPGQTSDVKTKYLQMTLDHDTGEIFGTVRAGSFKGRALEDLEFHELADLYELCRRKDRQSASVLETYLDRMRGDEWDEYVRQNQHETSTDASSDRMTTEEALQILGLQPGATREEIIDAHRTLMQKNHPDRGGSSWLASQINRAKDLLLS